MFIHIIIYIIIYIYKIELTDITSPHLPDSLCPEWFLAAYHKIKSIIKVYATDNILKIFSIRTR